MVSALFLPSSLSSHYVALQSFNEKIDSKGSNGDNKCMVLDPFARSKKRRSFLQTPLLAPAFVSVAVGATDSPADGIEATQPSLVSSSNWKEGFLQVYRRGTTYKMFYKIFDPEFLYSKTSPPIITIHGGPSLPSDYVLPLADALSLTAFNNKENRSIVFFDQIGCGLSDSPKDKDKDYSIEFLLSDLQTLIENLNLSHYHIYGHSFGGMLAYEYVRRGLFEKDAGLHKDTAKKCQSLVLSSAPISTRETYEELTRIEKELLKQDPNPFTLDERLRKTCLCRTPKQPKPLDRAYKKAGKVWYGLDVVMDFECMRLPIAAGNQDNGQRMIMPNALILRGEYDFVSQDVLKRWTEEGRFFHKDSKLRTRVFENCSHHVLLENGEEYGTAINSFLKEND